ncbi:DUF1499 domain-containing protein [Gracilimonas mengyeensis]|uniref:Uncharacterized conserved protein, DUF1499 family n=1 Tax=Gracilimonas mengyeensis TaxID=1302730 RepID=A0A521FLF1_9BACT|nr:DUF1499 domain-containing protein [Gracilimonas mengyeensis]SMO97032.1 Uncharacterized conserved protein, DUF1499 family [Gracilimonas mengyeensis]
MAEESVKNPLPACPATPNCVRTTENFKHGIEQVFASLIQLLEQQAHSFEVTDPKRIQIHAVYRIPVFGFKDDVDIILEEAEDGSSSILYIRSASRLGAYDLGVNKRRVKRLVSELHERL